MRQFLKGITLLSKITGQKYHNIAHILLGLIIDMKLPGGESNVVLLKATRAMLDFLYLAEYLVHSTESLRLLGDALDRFHASKHVFVEIGIQNDFNLPKLHFLCHYVNSIKWVGTTDVLIQNIQSVYILTLPKMLMMLQIIKMSYLK